MNEVFEYNQIHLFGLLIEEPMAVFTDLTWGALCVFFAYRIHKFGQAGLIHTYFKLFFLLLGIAVFLGGTLGHAFHYTFNYSMWAKTPGWLISMIATVMLERAAIQHTRIAVKPGIIKFLNVMNVVEYFTFLALSLIFLKFIYIQLHTAYGLMVVVFFLETLTYIKKPNKMGKYILIGVGFSMLAGVVDLAKIAPATWFDQLSLSHLLLMLGAWFMYKGAMQLNSDPLEELSIQNKAA